MTQIPEKLTLEQLNDMSVGKLPGHLGIVINYIGKDEVRSEIVVHQHHMAPNGFLHAGCVVTLADTSCGYGCRTHLPKSASGFTTIELKSNHLGTTREGTIECIAKPIHLGGSTQVWDAVVTHKESRKIIAMFRCTQMVLYPRKEVPHKISS